MKVQIVYRNYKPLHSMFTAAIKYPPAGVSYIVPEPKQFFKKFPKLFWLYRRFGRNKVIQLVLFKVVDPMMFALKSTNKDSSADLLHFINIIPLHYTSRPYVIEFEHVGALFSFVFDKRQEKNVKAGLLNDNCKKIICSTQAAKKTLMMLFGSDYRLIESKVVVIYPAIDRQIIKFPNRQDIASKPQLRLLFVGNDSYRKGFEELLIALNKLKPDLLKTIKLTVISNDAGPIIHLHKSNSLDFTLLEPKFTKSEIINQFYMQSDLLLLPTKQDTFGFAILDALSCGTPVLATKHFAIPEIITEGTDGILVNLSRSIIDEELYLDKILTDKIMQSNVDPVLIADIEQSITKLAKNPKTLVKMSQAATLKFKKNGRFSIESRDEALLKTYQEALN